MFRSITLSIVVAGSMIGCNNDESLRQEQQAEQRALQQEQAQEQRELQQEQAAERAAAAEAASARLQEQTEDVQEERQDVTAEARQLQETIALACQGTPANIADTCPIESRTTASTTAKSDGVTVHLSAQAGTEAEVERRIDCYRARASLRAAATPAGAPAARPAANACMFDLADVDVDVTQRDGHVVVDFTSAVRARVEELKAHARQLSASIATPAGGLARN
jgi:chromosome condensin MukBEF ATPase and DNA-binding subunit MukB